MPALQSQVFQASGMAIDLECCRRPDTLTLLYMIPGGYYTITGGCYMGPEGFIWARGGVIHAWGVLYRAWGVLHGPVGLLYEPVGVLYGPRGCCMSPGAVLLYNLWGCFIGPGGCFIVERFFWSSRWPCGTYRLPCGLSWVLCAFPENPKAFVDPPGGPGRVDLPCGFEALWTLPGPLGISQGFC